MAASIREQPWGWARSPHRAGAAGVDEGRRSGAREELGDVVDVRETGTAIPWRPPVPWVSAITETSFPSLVAPSLMWPLALGAVARREVLLHAVEEHPQPAARPAFCESSAAVRPPDVRVKLRAEPSAHHLGQHGDVGHRDLEPPRQIGGDGPSRSACSPQATIRSLPSHLAVRPCDSRQTCVTTGSEYVASIVAIGLLHRLVGLSP